MQAPQIFAVGTSPRNVAVGDFNGDGRSDAQAILPADYTFTAFDAGSHTFTATLETAGSQSLAVTWPPTTPAP